MTALPGLWKWNEKLEYVQLQAIAKSPEGFPFATPITTFSVEISQARHLVSMATGLKKT